MFKAAIKREESQACLDYPEREQARGAASMFNVQWSTMSEVVSLKSDVDKQQCSMFKAAIEREESQACLDYPEREQARSVASMFNAQCSMFNDQKFSALIWK